MRLLALLSRSLPLVLAVSTVASAAPPAGAGPRVPPVPRLFGTFEPVGLEKGSYRWLREGEEILGAVLRTRKGVQPLFISVGHRISLPTALRYVLGCTTKYRLPETTRQAHRLASQEKD